MKNSSSLIRDRFVLMNMFILITFASIYRSLGKDHFSEDMTWSNSFYFAMVTQSTVGYGDILPLTDFSKWLVFFHIFVSLYYNVLEVIDARHTRFISP